MPSRSLTALGVLLILALSRIVGSQSFDRNRLLYIGTYTSHGSKGIYAARFDEQTGIVSRPTLAATAVDPSFLALNPRLPVLYAANEGSNQVSSFAIAPGSGELKELNRMPSPGGPCHLALDRTGRMLLVANYGSGSFNSYPVLPDGRISPAAASVQFTGSGPNPKRQESPHAHFAYYTEDNRFALITDLGTDRIMVYGIHPETAGVDPAKPPFGVDNPGAGPRHLVFSPDQRFIYVLNEIQSSVTRFSYNASTGALRNIDTASALPAGFQGQNTAAEIAINPQGHWLVVSNRGDDSLVVFSIDGTGALRQIQHVSSGGRSPRSFALDPSGRWLLAANQDSGNIRTFHVDPVSGRLTPTPNSIEMNSPVCLLFAGQKLSRTN